MTGKRTLPGLLPGGVLLLLLACGLFAVLPSAAAPADTESGRKRPSMLTGTFIQYQPWMKRLTDGQWQNELDAMRQSGLRVVVVQWIVSDGVDYGSNAALDEDITETICRYADTYGLKVYVGLSNDDAWWTSQRNAELLGRLASANAAAAAAASRYVRHASFAGWYIPQEFNANLSDADRKSLRDYYGRVARACRSIAPKPVFVSGFFGVAETPAELAATTRKVLSGSGIDTILLQDGVGAEHRDTSVETIRPYLIAEREACRDSHTALWIVPESFAVAPLSSTTFVPAAFDRFRQQLELEQPYAAALITFDFFHYMSPYRGKAQQQLDQDYIAFRNRQ